MKKLAFTKLAALMPQPKPRKQKTTLRVTASRLVPSAFDEDEEPTTKLSTAIVVVLILHLAAVGGIYAFHSIKSHRREADGTALPAGNSTKKPVPPAAVSDTRAAKMQAAEKAASPQNPVQTPAKTGDASNKNFAPTPAPAQAKAPAGVPAGGALEKSSGPSAVLSQPKSPVASPASVPAANKGAAEAAPVGAEPGQRTYVVKRGDNPWSIAKAHGVSYDELIKINGLENPKKLQLNQVLKLPPKRSGN